MTQFTLAVLRERARMALADPEGEQEAVKPMSPFRAQHILDVCEVLELGLRRGLKVIVETWETP